MDHLIYQKPCTQFLKVHRTFLPPNCIAHAVTFLIRYVLGSGVGMVIKDWLLPMRAPEPTDTHFQKKHSEESDHFQPTQ